LVKRAVQFKHYVFRVKIRKDTVKTVTRIERVPYCIKKNTKDRTGRSKYIFLWHGIIKKRVTNSLENKLYAGRRPINVHNYGRVLPRQQQQQQLHSSVVLVVLHVKNVKKLIKKGEKTRVSSLIPRARPELFASKYATLIRLRDRVRAFEQWIRITILG